MSGSIEPISSSARASFGSSSNVVIWVSTSSMIMLKMSAPFRQRGDSPRPMPVFDSIDTRQSREARYKLQPHSVCQKLLTRYHSVSIILRPRNGERHRCHTNTRIHPSRAAACSNFLLAGAVNQPVLSEISQHSSPKRRKFPPKLPPLWLVQLTTVTVRFMVGCIVQVIIYVPAVAKV